MVRAGQQHLLTLSLVCATGVVVLVHLFVFPVYESPGAAGGGGGGGRQLLGDLERTLCSGNLRPLRARAAGHRGGRCPGDGIVTVTQGGRLGNQMWEYASVWAVARRTGLEPYVPRCIRAVLDAVFQGLSVPPLSHVAHCRAGAGGWGGAAHAPDCWSAPNQSIVLPRFSVLPELVLSWADDVRAEFRFRRELSEAGAHTLRVARRSVLGADDDDDVVFVGVHVRRTDYRDYLWRSHGVAPAGVAYFSAAMDYFRDKFRRRRVVFLVVSDDPAWCRRHLQARDVFVVSQQQQQQQQAGAGKGGSAGKDLAVMAACNHSVIDYGTFGVWGAILAGGETIVYNVSTHSSVRVSQLLPGWQVMN